MCVCAYIRAIVQTPNNVEDYIFYLFCPYFGTYSNKCVPISEIISKFTSQHKRVILHSTVLTILNTEYVTSGNWYCWIFKKIKYIYYVCSKCILSYFFFMLTASNICRLFHSSCDEVSLPYL